MSQLILPGNTGPGDVRAGKLFSAGLYYNAQGTLVDRAGAAVVLTPGPADIVIPGGIYGELMADGKVAAVVFNAAKVLNDTTIAGTQGAMPNNPSPTTNLTAQGATKTVPLGYSPGGAITVALPDNGSQSTTLTNQGQAKTIPAGYTSSVSTITTNITNLVASNIINTAVVGGIAGTALNLPYIAGSDISLGGDSTVFAVPGSWTKCSKRITILGAGTIRVFFTMQNGASQTTYLQLYKNSAAFGTLRTRIDNWTVPITYSEDFSCNAGDYFEVWAYSALVNYAHVNSISVSVAGVSGTTIA